ncbi:MAG: hypothetical protein QY329_12660 [Anaerolineales bacterium]|nr:MAG: hypothetical protein QY329_12660 [Anaerolineales bacterium]HPO87661.1 hypothetical protein [Candidatus Hydrogenedentota bacterium]
MNKLLNGKSVLLVLLCWSLSSCYPGMSVDNVSQTATPSLKATDSVVPLPLSTFTSTPFRLILPTGTLSLQESESALLELLRTNGNCTGKCIGGIRPDEMTVQEAVNTLSQWGMVGIYHDYFGKTYIGLNAPPLDDTVGVYLSIGTWTKEFETIDNVSFRIQNIGGGNIETDLWSENRYDWKGFRLDNLLKAYGVPSYVGFYFESMFPIKAVRYIIEIQFQDLQIAISSQAIGTYEGKDVFLCLAKDPQYFGMAIYPETPLKERWEFAPVTWQSLSGTNLEAFYRMFTDKTNPDACIITNLEQIQLLQPYFR